MSAASEAARVLRRVTEARQAAAHVIRTQHASTAAIMRSVHVGRPRAEELMTDLEDHGIVAAALIAGAPSREVLVRADQLDAVLAAEFPIPGARR